MVLIEYFMVLNSKKCYFMCIGIDRENETFNLNMYVIKLWSGQSLKGCLHYKSIFCHKVVVDG